MDKHKADTREARGISWVDELLQDLKYGLRGLAKNPGYAALAILTLGLGIGANTAIFSVINGVLLKPLPYEHGERLVVVRQSAPLSGQNQVGVAIAEYFDYRDQAQVFDGLVEYHQMNFDLLNRGEPDRVSTGVVSHNFFDLLGIKPIVGRTFVATDDLPGAEAVLVLSHTYWRTRFGGDPDIVGQVFEMNDRPHRVIGVLPNVPHYPQENDVYMPVLACPFRAAAERNIPQNRRAFGGLSVFGRVKDGHTHEEAAAAIATINQRFTADHAGVYRTATSGFQATALDVRSALTEGARDLLLILLGITSLVLLIACANVANLTLARMLGRDRELALRTALGAGRGRLVRQLLTESTLLATVGGIVGVLFAWGTIGMLTRFVGRFTQRTGEVSLDPAVLLFTLGVSVVTGLLFGTLPALGSRVTLTNALKQGSNQAGEAGNRRRMQGALIVAQVAVSVMLLVGAGLLLASFYRLQQVDPGYRSDGVLSAQVYGNFSRYGNINALRRLYLPILDRLEGQPGVVSAAITNAVPLAGAAPGTTRFDIDGRVTDDPDRRPTTDVRVASERYFETIGIATVSGRVFAATDTAESLPVVVINRAMARYWDEVDPVGTRLSLNRGETWLTIVGVVADVRQFGLAQETVAQIYVPLAQSPLNFAGPGAGPHGFGAGRVRDRAADGRVRRGPEPAGRERPDAERSALRGAGGSAADRRAAQRLRRPRAARHPGGYRRRDRHIGDAADAGVRRAHGARREPRDGDGHGVEAGADPGGDRAGGRHHRGRSRRAGAVNLSLPDRAARSRDHGGGRLRLPGRGHARLPRAGAQGDDGGPADCAADGVKRKHEEHEAEHEEHEGEHEGHDRE